MSIIRAVILTKSNMFGNFCVAGIDVSTGQWVRFVANQKGDPLTREHLRLQDGGECEPLDVVDVDVSRHVPARHHTENYLIRPRLPWVKIAQWRMGDVLDLHPVETHRFLYGDFRPYLEEPFLSKLNFNYSLILIQVRNLAIEYERNAQGEVKPKASFSYNRESYRWIRVTDPFYAPDEEGDAGEGIAIGDAYLVVSLPQDSYHGKYYKLIAKIFPIDPF